MAPALKPRMPVVARAEPLSPGAIAGAVVGSVVGGSLLLIILGFVYFRYRRMLKEAQAEDPLAVPKGPVAEQSTSLPWQGVLPGQTPTTHSGHPPSDKDLGSERAVPAGDTTDQHRSPVSPHGDGWMRNNEDVYHQQAPGRDSLPQDVDFSLPARESTDPTSPAAANSTYYDIRISMHSEPEQPYLPPSRQMSDLYRAQQQDAEDLKKRSGSLPRRILNSFKRKRSTHSSTRGQGTAPSPPQQYFPTSPVESPVSIKQEPGLKLPAGTDEQSQPVVNRLFTEPEEISESVVPGTTRTGSGSENIPQHHKRQKRWAGDSQYGESPLRTDSAIRETTERDPELPSSALRTDSTYGLPPTAQPPSPAQPQPQERLKSPDIPEPMDIDDLQSHAPGQSVFRGSHSPPLPPESFVVPMAIMQPTNAVEKAAYTDYQMENSASPPAISPSPPEIVTDQPSQYQDGDLDLVNEHDFADKYLDLPSDDEPRLSGDSYEYSTTTPGQSSTDPSCGRTPDTRITASPSPFPNVPEHVKMEISPSTSPEVSRLSPQGAPLTCEDCGRQFDQIHKLNHHKRYHDRKHECPYDGCDKKFGTKTHLDRHINDKHEKLKAYHCTEPTCPYFKGGKFFARKDNWRRHMVKKHGAGAQDLEAMDESHG